MVGITSKTGLIGTKYSRPGINQYLVSRLRLYQKLDNALQSKLTMVMAPAGYGKTTAVLDWLGKGNLPAAWVSLDSRDNDPVTFWQYVCASLEGIAGGISKDAEYVFSARELMKANIHINILIDRLSEIQSHFLLVLDDLQLVSAPPIMAGLSHLIDYLPPQMHLVFISRAEPELELARHRIKWQVQRLEEKDLRFEEEEILRFYQVRGITLKSNELKAVESYTEGWAAALVAVTLSMEDGGGHDAIAALARSSRDIGQYLRDEVIRAWRPERIDFAMKTSILDTLWPDLCNAVTGNDSGRGLLREIVDGNGFMTDLDGQRQAYRYHHLFKSFLRDLLQERSPEEIPQLHAKAGLWFQGQGLLPEAIEHFLSGGAYRRAFAMIEHRIDHLIHKNDFGRLLSWIERLPKEYRDSSFKSACIYALYYAETGQYDLSWQWIGRMKALQDSYPYAPGPQWNSYSRTACLMVEANLLLREGNMGFMGLILAAAETDGGRYYKIPEYNDLNKADIYFYRCPANRLTDLFRQDPEQYGRMTESYRMMITKNPGYAPLIIGEYLYESNRFEESLPHLMKALDEARSTRCPGALVPAMVDLARIKRAQGDMPGAFEVLEECETEIRRFGQAHWIYLIQAFRCRLYMDAGDTDGVEEWFAGCRLNSITQVNRIREFELMVYARVLLARGRLHDARPLLQRLLVFTEEKARLHSRVEVLNLLALLDFENNKLSGAVNYLESSLETGMKEGYVRSFIDEFTPLARLLRYYITSRKKGTGQPAAAALRAYAKSLLKQMHENPPTNRAVYDEGAAGGVKDFLTAQEKKVLQLIVEANTNQEISQKLGIALRTVKNHIANIYGKLGVKNRAQCIKLVRESGLL